MKRIIILNSTLLIGAIIGLGCSSSNNFSGDEEKVKNVTIQAYARNYKPSTMNITAIKLLQNITVEDSMNYFLQYSDEIIHDHDAAVQKLNYWLDQKQSKSYSDFDVNAEIARWTDELNKYVDAYEGGKTFSEKWAYEYVYKKLYEFRQMEPDKVLRKIYSVTYTVTGMSKSITEIRSFDADITTTFGTYSDMERINWLVKQQRDPEKIHFNRPGENRKELPDAGFIREGGEIKDFDEEK